MNVINRGAQAVTISSIGLQPLDPSYMPRDYARDSPDNPDWLPESNNDPLPLRMKGHGALRWMYGPEVLDTLPNGMDVKGYAKVYRSFRWPWSRELTKRTVKARRTERI